ncbi:hypothetical protein CDD81_7756 [Ophiocordyceps australis]|uniref:Glycoside hydrolase subgroup catalytic core protein n=1 Tax=Ophiocordyceps australis TaxID=1399860 RepID=A0A2C5Y3U0_9HYPO|nr:hypothetical protein CDD81_7756 [Ophiocordyceps australis]
MHWSMVAWALALVTRLGDAVDKETGRNVGWPRWCGKVYKPEYPSFDPGGQTLEPPRNGDELLNLKIKPRWSIFLQGEHQGQFILNATPSPWFGQQWPLLKTTPPPMDIVVDIQPENVVLLRATIQVPLVDSITSFDLDSLAPRLEPYRVRVTGFTGNEIPITARTEFYYLPEKTSGSVTRLDNLNGGFHHRSPATHGRFEPFLPYGFYASCDRFLCDKNSRQLIKKYHDDGFNSLVSLTTVFDSRAEYEYMESLDLRFMYDLRSYYKNLTAVREQVTAIKDSQAIFAYWASDEPDGHQDAFHLVTDARDVIRSIDPYHPLAVTLNCQDYYYGPYTAGADIVMEDAYPIGINTTWSKWGTTCNTTYGDCGCDNCRGGVYDVPERLDILARHERWLNLWPKTKVHNLQAFHGEGYWARSPSLEELNAMNALALMHGSKAQLAWLWPTSDDEGRHLAAFAPHILANPMRDLIVRGRATRARVECAVDKLHDQVDAAYWQVGDKLLLLLVSRVTLEGNHGVNIALPSCLVPQRVVQDVWGNGRWLVQRGQLSLSLIRAMSVYMVVVDVMVV